MCTAHAQMCAHVTDPISICRKIVDLTASRWCENTKTLQTLRGEGGGGLWVAPYYGCSLSPGKAAGISRAFHWYEKGMSSDQIYLCVSNLCALLRFYSLVFRLTNYFRHWSCTFQV